MHLHLPSSLLFLFMPSVGLAAVMGLRQDGDANLTETLHSGNPTADMERRRTSHCDPPHTLAASACPSSPTQCHVPYYIPACLPRLLLHPPSYQHAYAPTGGAVSER
uniref:Uncharacterized protein n=1 Tax=Vitrella brassicaformis TaxID=1169539 RepID=A0A7S1JWG6_9ALVE|mmetsp:Transcript_26873/g.66945  ORF Transcript_26873/g.66945 Transcript_26873/m.66945 type:complete len:107 (+) Transcript_26873:1141-1461(+)